MATYSDIQINLQYTRTFQALLKNPVILEQVKRELDLPYSAGRLGEKIATSSESESEIINISVQDENIKSKKNAKAIPVINAAPNASKIFIL